MNTPISLPFKGMITVFFVALTLIVNAQVVEFSDDFESGTASWVLTDLWGVTNTNSNSPSNSLTESPVGNYGDVETSSATLANAIDLSTVLDANLSFWAIYDIEGGFDYMYVEASSDGGANWVGLASFDGENNLTPWVQYSYSLGGFVGSANVFVRFRFVSDGAVTEDGMYIDDVLITSNSIDNSPPLILHTGPVMHEASLGDQNVIAEIIDISGISVAELSYSADGGAPLTVSGVNTTGDDYLFVVPALAAGSWVDYWITAIDASDSLNSATSDTSSYISGNYLVYDNAQIDFVNSYGPGSPGGYSGAAVAITLLGTTDLVTSLIRNYTDVNRPNDSMLVHVWGDAGGVPGADLITPFMMYPEATLSEPNRITRVDLRPFSAQLSNLSGNVYVGFTVPTGEVWVSQTTPGIAARTYVDSNGTWFTITDDYQFRAITDSVSGAPVADFSFDLIGDPTVAFTDLTINSPSTWSWDFGDGTGTSTVNNPSYTYAANGSYNVCLTATNIVGSSTVCKLVTILNVPTVADFSTPNTNFCQGLCINYTDMSTNNPLTWNWSFPGGTPATDTTENPSVCYNTVGSFDVVLIVSNAAGVDTMTMISYITVTTCPPPVASFIVIDTNICEGDAITFSDLSTNSPLTWAWSFPGGLPSSDTMQNPIVMYSTAGSYAVTLVTSNLFGMDSVSVADYITVNAVPTQPTISASGSTTICQGEFVTLTSSSSGGNMWSTGETTISIAVTASASITLVIDSTGCPSQASAVTQVTANVNPPIPSITANGNVLSSDAATSYQWYEDTMLLTGETFIDYTITQSGIYLVEVTDGNGCSTTSAPFNATFVVGIHELISDVQFKVYPVPTNGEVQIEIQTSGLGDYVLELTNFVGDVIFMENLGSFQGTYRKTLDLEAYSQGVYFLQLKGGDLKITRKIVVF